jgi:hypothetical protein
MSGRSTLKSPRFPFFPAALLAAALALAGCGGGGGGGDAPPEPTASPDNLNGTWVALETVTASTCGGVGGTSRYAVTISQAGREILVATPLGGFTGSVDGSAATWTGEVYDAGRSRHLALTLAAVEASGDSLSGTLQWETRATPGGAATCSGASSFTASRAYPPGAPLALKATAIDHQSIQLSWDNDASQRDAIVIYRGVSPDSVSMNLATLGGDCESYPDSGLMSETAYYYRAQAFNLVGNSPLSQTASATTPVEVVIPPPAAPGGLSAVIVTSTRLTLYWSDNSSDENGFIVYRGVGGGPTATASGKAGAGATSLGVGGLLPGRTYTFLVKAHNGGGLSGPSNTITVVMPDTVTDDSWSLTIDMLTNSCGATLPNNIFTSVNVTFPTPTTISIATRDGTLTGTVAGDLVNVSGALTIHGVAPGDTMDIDVTKSALIISADRAGMSGTAHWIKPAPGFCQGRIMVTMTRPLSSATTPATPSAPALSVRGSRSTRLTWTDNASDEMGFSILRGEGVGAMGAVDQVGADVSAYLDTGLAPATRYVYSVQAFNAAGNSALSASVRGTTLAVPVLAGPSTAGPSFQPSWSFEWPAGGALAGDGYVLEESFNSASSGFTVVLDSRGSSDRASPRTWQASGKAAGTWYYRVRAFAAAPGAFSDLSNTLAVTVSATPLPAAPSRLRVEPLGTTGGRLTWTDNSNNETGFTVKRWYTGSMVSSEVASLPAGTVTWDDSGLISTKTYYYEVKAFNGGGSSEYSNTATLTFPVDTGGAPAIKTFTPLYDNSLYGNSETPRTAKLVSGADPSLGVGTTWVPLSWAIWDPVSESFITTNYLGWIKGRSLVKFDLSSIAGRTVTKATLKLYPVSLPSDYSGLHYQACEVTSDWNPATVCGNTTLSWSLADAVSVDPPFNLAIPCEWDVTAIVQRWAGGSSVNRGFYIWDPQDGVVPGNPLGAYIRAVWFDSRESSAEARRPALVVELQ